MVDENAVLAAFTAVAEHFGVDPHQVTRDQMREARKAGIHSLPEKALGGHAGQKAAIETVQPSVPQGHHIKGVSTLLDGEGNVKGQWIKTHKPAEQREQTLERLVKGMSALVPARKAALPNPSHKHHDSDLLDVYPMGDPHIGMLSWAPETGADFDLDIARGITRNAIDHLTRDAQAETALILNLGDFFHSDTLHNTTTRGTNVDVDGRMYKILEVGLELMIYVIDAALLQHVYVEVDNRNGNHDTVTSMFLSLALEQYYRNEPRVTIHPNRSKFFYKVWGRNLVGATHGDTVKFNQLSGVMAVDRAKDWGDTEHRFWYVGHVHHTSRIETYGVTIETFRTLASGDAWHHAKGYRSNHDMNRITLHAQDGEVARATVNSKALARRYKELAR